MKILLVTQFFDPEPTIKGVTLAQGLADRGHEVRVLTGFPNYPSGTLAEGYHLRWRQRDLVGSVVVDRMWLFPSHDRSVLRRAANYLSYSASSTFRAITDSWRPDVVWAHHPPVTAAAAALAASRRWDAPLVLEVQDLWPQSLGSTGMVGSPRVLQAVGRAMDHVYRRSSAILVISQGFRAALVDAGVPPERVRVLPNWADERRLQPGTEDLAWARGLQEDGVLNVAFTGNMGPAQALDTVLDAAHRLQSAGVAVRLHMVGDGLDEPRLRARASTESLTNVTFHGRQPMARASATVTESDVALVHLSRDPLFTITIPSKTQGYLFLGAPVVMGASGDPADLVEKAGAGLVAPPEDAEALAAALRRMAEAGADERRAMGESGREYYRRVLSVDAGLDAYEATFADVCS